MRLEEELVVGSLGGGITSVSIGGMTLGLEVDTPSNELLVFFGVAPARPFFAAFPTAKAGRTGEWCCVGSRFGEATVLLGDFDRLPLFAARGGENGSSRGSAGAAKYASRPVNGLGPPSV